MPYFAVSSGNLFRCVCADDAKSACVNAVAAHLKDEFEEEEGCSPGVAFKVAVLGESSGETTYILATHVLESGNFSLARQDGETSYGIGRVATGSSGVVRFRFPAKLTLARPSPRQNPP